MLSYLHWDPSPSIFPWDLPLLGRPILWYGVLFALGFFLAYVAFLTLLKQDTRKEIREKARKIADEVSTYLLIGILLGARLFDIFFNEKCDSFVKDPLFIFRLWEGGLSS